MCGGRVVIGERGSNVHLESRGEKKATEDDLTTLKPPSSADNPHQTFGNQTSANAPGSKCSYTPARVKLYEPWFTGSQRATQCRANARDAGGVREETSTHVSVKWIQVCCEGNQRESVIGGR